MCKETLGPRVVISERNISTIVFQSACTFLIIQLQFAIMVLSMYTVQESMVTVDFCLKFVKHGGVQFQYLSKKNHLRLGLFCLGFSNNSLVTNSCDVTLNDISSRLLAVGSFYQSLK